MNQSKHKPCAIVAHGMWGRGGAEAAAMWIISALSETFDVTVYTRCGFDLEALNELAGTSLSPEALEVRWARVEGGVPVGAWAAGRFLRSLHSIAEGFDLCVSASGILPWGRPAIHFLSSIDCDPELSRRLWQAGRIPLKARISRIVQRVASGVRQPKPEGFFVTNSEWLKGQCAHACSGPIEVIHPAVPAPSKGLPWKDREDAVLVFGRISPEKRIEACIEIVGLARADGFAGKLVIAGPDGQADYAAHIRELAAARDWITIMPSQSGEERDALLGKVRYGLNACLFEAFGISSAEMTAAGIIMLVPQGTGQDEIVSDPIQRYASELDASSKLVMLGSNAALQTRLHEKAHLVRGRFDPAEFAAAVQRVAQKAISLKTEGAARHAP